MKEVAEIQRKWEWLDRLLKAPPPPDLGEDERWTSTVVAVGAAICSFADKEVRGELPVGEEGECFATKESLAFRAKVSARSVQKAIRMLERHGCIYVAWECMERDGRNAITLRRDAFDWYAPSLATTSGPGRSLRERLRAEPTSAGGADISPPGEQTFLPGGADISPGGSRHFSQIRPTNTTNQNHHHDEDDQVARAERGRLNESTNSRDDDLSGNDSEAPRKPPGAPQPFRELLSVDARLATADLKEKFRGALGITLSSQRARWAAAYWTREELHMAIDKTAAANSPCWAYFAKVLETIDKPAPAKAPTGKASGMNWDRTAAYGDDWKDELKAAKTRFLAELASEWRTREESTPPPRVSERGDSCATLNHDESKPAHRGPLFHTQP